MGDSARRYGAGVGSGAATGAAAGAPAGPWGAAGGAAVGASLGAVGAAMDDQAAKQEAEGKRHQQLMQSINTVRQTGMDRALNDYAQATSGGGLLPGEYLDSNLLLNDQYNALRGPNAAREGAQKYGANYANMANPFLTGPVRGYVEDYQKHAESLAGQDIANALHGLDTASAYYGAGTDALRQDVDQRAAEAEAAYEQFKGTQSETDASAFITSWLGGAKSGKRDIVNAMLSAWRDQGLSDQQIATKLMEDWDRFSGYLKGKFQDDVFAQGQLFRS